MDEAALLEPSHLELHCIQIQLFLFFSAFKVLDV